MVTKIQLAAMSRADQTESSRRPFYLYVDEFQNFATDSFAVILSEARKYRLYLTVANQYISQMEQPVRDAVFGNVGTIISFRVSPDDSPFLQKYFEPEFEAPDIIAQHSRHFIISMMINGEKAAAFSAKTLDLPEAPKDLTDDIVDLSRHRFSKTKTEVEDIILQATKLPSSNADTEKRQYDQLGNRPKSQLMTVDRHTSHQERLGSLVTHTTEASQNKESQQEPREGNSRNRRRRGRGGSANNYPPGNSPNPQQSRPNDQNPANEKIIKLR
jgi:hypothetical protein